MADASPVPVLLYNVAVFTGVSLPVGAFARLAAHPNIIGIKESGPDLELLARYIAHAPAGFAVLCGAHATLYPAVCIGARGGVLAVAGVIPDLCAELFDLASSGRHDEALALQRRIEPFCELAVSPVRRGRPEGGGGGRRIRGGSAARTAAPASSEALALLRRELEALLAST